MADDGCQITYAAQTRGYGGEWLTLTDQFSTSTEAVQEARDFLRDYGYKGCAVRVTKTHVHRDVTVLQEVTL